jgi:microcystin-dependent protein
MADSFSTLLNLRLQQTGGNDNTWGDLLNSDALTPLENAIAGKATHAVTGGALDLSASPLVEQVHVFTGLLSSDETVTLPKLDKRTLIVNATTGAFFLLLKTAGGATTCIPQGTSKDIRVDGTSGTVTRLDAADVGEIKYFGGTTAPAGHLECDGSAVLRASAPDLFAAIGTTWGAGNGATTFNLPDFKTAGRFLRSRSGSVAAGTMQAADIAAHNHSASASTGVSLSIAADGGHGHTISISDPTHTHDVNTAQNGATILVTTMEGGGGGSSNQTVNYTQGSGFGFRTTAIGTGIGASASSVANHSHAGSSASASTSVTVNNSTGTETRPINVSALACIRY